MTHPIGWRRALLALFCLLVFGFLMLPLVIVFPVSLGDSEFLKFPPESYSWRWYEAYFTSSGWIEATLLSLRVAALAALLCLALGIPMAFYLVRSRQRLVAAVVDKLVVSPMIIPAVVTAIAIYSLFSSWRWIGTWYGLVLAHAVLALPVMVIILTAGLRQFDRTLEDAAVGLGAHRVRAVLHVTLPVIQPSILSGLFLSFMTSFDDLIVALFISGSNVTLPKKMFDNIGYALDPTIAAVSALQILLLVLIGLGAYALQRRQASRTGVTARAPLAAGH